jgi:hypothetical protein
LQAEKQGSQKKLDFRIYFAIIRSALADFPRLKTRRNGNRRCVLSFLGLQPSADALSLGIGWDAMEPTGTNIGAGEGEDEKIGVITVIADIAEIGKERTYR